MGAKERRERQKENLRQEILEAAGELFAREGYDSVSMRKIADKIEYSPTTIYLYFRDKADLLKQICDQTFARMIERIERAGATADDPVESLRRGCRAYIEFGVEHPHHYLSTFVVHHAEPPLCAERFEESLGARAFQTLVEGIAGAMKAGAFREMDVLEAASSWWAMLHGVTVLLIAERKLPWFETVRFIDQSIELLVRGMRK